MTYEIEGMLSEVGKCTSESGEPGRSKIVMGRGPKIHQNQVTNELHPHVPLPSIISDAPGDNYEEKKLVKF